MAEQNTKDYFGVRDLRVYHAWQSQNALRILFENYTGVESRNLITLYVALTLKATYVGFQDTFHTTSKDIVEYTGLSHDFVPQGLKTLEEAGLIKSEERRSEKGYVLGKTISLLDAPSFVPNSLQKIGTSFLDSSVYNVKKEFNIYTESKDSSYTKKKEISEDIKETSAADRKSGTWVHESIWNNFSDIIDYANSLHIFATPKIKEGDGGVYVPKYLLQAIRKMMLLHEGKFAEYYHTEAVAKDKWREKVFEALDNFKIMKEDMRIWPYDKSTMPKNLDTFFFNPRSNFSWFIKCLETPVTQKEELIEEKYGDVVEEKHILLFDKWFDYYLYELTYEEELNCKRNIGELIVAHKEIWEQYGQYYSKMGKWNQYLGGIQPDKFIAKFAEFLLEKHFHAHEAAIRPTSKAFAAFKQWLRLEYGLDITMSEDKRQELVRKAEGKTIQPTVQTNQALPKLAEV